MKLNATILSLLVPAIFSGCISIGGNATKPAVKVDKKYSDPFYTP
jgi:hypothetical protein